jgi:transposase
VTVEVVKRPPAAKGFVVICRRWVVERNPDQVRGRLFAWIMKCRRLVRDYEQLTAVAETLITVADIATLVRPAALFRHTLRPCRPRR